MFWMFALLGYALYHFIFDAADATMYFENSGFIRGIIDMVVLIVIMCAISFCFGGM